MSSSWWAEKIRAEMPQAPPPPRYENIAPGAWWQQTRQEHPTLPEQPQAIISPNHAPADLCPRCGGENYVQISVDPSFGGQGGSMLRCFDCRYPMFDASGDIISSPGGGRRRMPGQPRPNFTRQVGGGMGSWSGDTYGYGTDAPARGAIWDNAVKIA
jgi:hypothetical protein